MSVDNNYCRSSNYKPGYEDDYGGGAATVFLSEKQQNSLNAREENSDRSYGIRWGKSQFMRSKRIGFALFATAFLILLLGIVSIFGFIVMMGMLGAQHSHLKSLQDEIASLKVQNDQLKNETAHHQDRTSTCENELQKVNHLVELNAIRCGLEKTNISNHFQSDIRDITRQKEAVENNLSDCESQKAKMVDLKENLESEMAAQKERLNQCNRVTDQQSESISEQERKLANVKCPPCRSSSVYSRSAAGRSSNRISKLLIMVASFLSSSYFYN